MLKSLVHLEFGWVLKRLKISQSFWVLPCTVVSLLAGCAAKNDNWSFIRDPAALNGKPVIVEGSVKNVQVSHAGKPFMVFDLCDPGCIKVFTGGNPRIIDGDRRVVHGTVRPWVGGPANAYLVVADPGSL